MGAISPSAGKGRAVCTSLLLSGLQLWRTDDLELWGYTQGLISDPHPSLMDIIPPLSCFFIALQAAGIRWEVGITPSVPLRNEVLLLLSFLLVSSPTLHQIWFWCFIRLTDLDDGILASQLSFIFSPSQLQMGFCSWQHSHTLFIKSLSSIDLGLMCSGVISKSY